MGKAGVRAEERDAEVRGKGGEGMGVHQGTSLLPGLPLVRQSVPPTLTCPHLEFAASGPRLIRPAPPPGYLLPSPSPYATILLA